MAAAHPVVSANSGLGQGGAFSIAHFLGARFLSRVESAALVINDRAIGNTSGSGTRTSGRMEKSANSLEGRAGALFGEGDVAPHAVIVRNTRNPARDAAMVSIVGLAKPNDKASGARDAPNLLLKSCRPRVP